MDELIALVEQAEDAAALAAMDRAAVVELLAQVDAAYAEVRASVRTSDDVAAARRIVAAMSALAGRRDAIDQAASTAAEELAALDAEVAALNVDPAEPEAGAGDAGEGEGGEGEGAGGAGGEAGGGDAGAGAGGEGAGGEGGEGGEGEGGSGGEQGAQPNRPDLNRLSRTPSQGHQSNEAGTDDGGTGIVATPLIAHSGLGQADIAPGQTMTLAQFGSTLERMHKALQVLPPGSLPEGVHAGGQKHYIASMAIAQRPGVVMQRRGDASEIIDQATREFVAARNERNANVRRLVASNGNCNILAQPDYSIRVIGETGTAFTDELPTVGGIERPLAYYPWLMINQANGASGPGSEPTSGIGFVTLAQDAAGYGDPTITTGDPGAVPAGGHAYKDCIHIDCPADPLFANIEAVYKCVTLGNFQANSHPEYVDAFQKYMDIWFDITRDQRALSAFTAQAAADSNMLTASELTFGAVSTMKDIFQRMLAKERSARHDSTITLNVVAPEWFGAFLALDVMRHTFGNLDNLSCTPQQAMALASTDGVTLSTYRTEAGPTTPHSIRQVLAPLSGGAIPAWPKEVRLLVYMDGSVFKKTGATLNAGLRETLVKTNDFGMFMELDEKVNFRGPVYVLDVELCANGATGAPVALVCTA